MGRGRHLGRTPNRECENCVPPCQGGEVLHRRGHCCHSYCPCEGFVEKSSRSPGLVDALHPQLRLRKPSREMRL
jgi:hypothetical protein